MNCLSNLEPDSGFVEVDPSGRYGRYNEILGKGASKIVYKAFDEYEGIEVAWNQVKLYDFLQSPEDLERLYSEIHLLKTLKHRNIMKFYTSWVDTANRNINFVTEMFTSGTLRQYRLKHKRVNIRAVKHWCRQILRGLLYLHSRDPPVIHRDLKCDNIFINGNQGEVKIGDLGLAAILRKPQAAHCVGTPEFMAPEIYEEAYNELVDIYSFGMCILEMVTFEYPYSECNNPAQIYKKVISGRKPDSLYKVKDPEVREFVEKCLATVSLRLSARELLDDPFLQIDDCESDLRRVDSGRELDELGPLIRKPTLECYYSNDSWSIGYPQSGYATPNDWMYPQSGYATPTEWMFHPSEIECSGIELFEHQEDESPGHLDISINGKQKEDGSIFLRIRIADQDGHIRNIYFPFDIDMDTALSVATEMVAELDITDQDVTKIADMIDGEITALVPDWKPGLGIEETPRFSNQNLCDNCSSNFSSKGSVMEFLSHSSDAKDLKLLQCCRNGCASMHGRFEEVSFQVDESEHHGEDGAPNASSESESTHYHETWSHLGSREITPVASPRNQFDNNCDRSDHCFFRKDENDASSREDKVKSDDEILGRHSTGSPPSFVADPSLSSDVSDHDYEREIQQELRWVKAKYEMGMRELRDQQLGLAPKPSTCNDRENGRGSSPVASLMDEEFMHMKLSEYDKADHLPSFQDYKIKSFPGSETQRARHREAREPSRSPVRIIDIPPSCLFLPHSLHRTASLPVDAVDM